LFAQFSNGYSFGRYNFYIKLYFKGIKEIK